MSRISKDLAESGHNTNGTSSGMKYLRRAADKMPKMAVIGAGMSGLRCADVLIRHGVKVTLFEARDRIGGRVNQVESGGYLIDMGPNWIHGTQGNPIMELAEKTKTVVVDPEEDGAVFDSQGRRMPNKEAVRLQGSMWAMIVDAFKYSDENSESIDSKTSLMDHFKTQLAQQNLDEKQLSNALNEAQTWGPFVGDPIERQSLKFFYLEECVDGGNVIVAGTYNDILREVGRPAVQSSAIQFNTEIVKLEIQPDHGVSITTSTGEEQRFDEVVLTAPLGWLKRNKDSAITPPIPLRLSQAIENVSYGRLEKLYITFPSAFWLEDPSSRSMSTTNYPIFTHFHAPTYAPHPESIPWNQTLVSLAHLPPPTAHPTLLFYIYGPCATHLVSQLLHHPIHSTSYNKILNDFARPFYGLLPNYSPTNPSCVPTSFLATQWQNDRLAGNGSYCNFQIGVEHADEDIEVMRDAGGLTEKGFWLAGEHTAPFVALGTTTGAWWSGEAVARRILERWGLEVGEDGLPKAHNEDEGLKKGLNDGKADGANLNGLAL